MEHSLFDFGGVGQFVTEQGRSSSSSRAQNTILRLDNIYLSIIRHPLKNWWQKTKKSGGDWQGPDWGGKTYGCNQTQSDVSQPTREAEQNTILRLEEGEYIFTL